MYKIIGILILFGLATFAYAALHDPTCPPGMTQPHNGSARGDLQIQSIIITAHKKTVIIGDRHLTIGDKIMGAKIVAIDQDTVTLQGQSGKFTIALFHPIIKTPVKNGEEL
jgi:hypothetical protein